jgi:pimeloyl-ACP methyl ester carboxylesterase
MKTTLVRQLALALLLAVAAHAEEFDSAGVKIHYTTTGQGDPVILVHGLYSSAKMNWELPGITATLAKSHQVIAPDCRGHGQSDKSEADDQYGVPMAEDVVRLMDHLHIPKAKIAGYSMGGMIVMKAEFKELLLAALQASPPPPPSVPAKTP